MNQHAAYLSGAASDMAAGLLPERLADPKRYDFVLHSSATKYVVFALAWGFTCIAITWALLFLTQPPENRDAAPWLLLVWYAVEAGFIARIIFPSRLTIDGKGFAYTRLWRQQRMAWAECGDFASFKPVRGLPMVQFKRRKPNGGSASLVLPENYGLPAGELAFILNELRTRAVSA